MHHLEVMNPTLLKIIPSNGHDSALRDEVSSLVSHLLATIEPPFKVAQNKKGTSYVRVIHESTTLESILSKCEPLVKAAAVSVSLNGRKWAPVSEITVSQNVVGMRNPGEAAKTLGGFESNPLPRPPPGGSPFGNITEIVVDAPPTEDDSLAHEEEIRALFPGTGGDDDFSPRPQQIQALSLLIDGIQAGYTDLFLQLPTGGGKSVVGHALSKFFGVSPAYHTVDKVALGDQYVRSLPVIHRIAGRRNYPCYMEMDPSEVNRSSAEVAERLAIQQAEAHVGGGDPFEGLRRKPRLTADVAPCSTVRVSGPTGGDRPYPCRFSQIPAELDEWECPDCGSEEIMHLCGSKGRWVDANDHWDSIAPFLAPARVCPYYRDRFLAANTSGVITTNDYYMRYPAFDKRPLATYDECDRLPNAVLRNLSLDITTRTVSRLIDVSMQSMMAASKGRPTGSIQNTLFTEGGIDTNDPAAYDVPDVPDFQPEMLENAGAWEAASGLVMAWLRRLVRRVEANIEADRYDAETKARVMIQISSMRSFLDSVIGTDNEANYYWETGVREDGIRWISLKPILIGTFAREILDARSQYRLYMSATVGDVEILTRELGLDPARVLYIRFDYSDFPLENRPVSAVRGGTMSYQGGEGRQVSDFLDHARIIHGIATRMYPKSKGMILPFSGTIHSGLTEAIKTRYPSIGSRLVVDSPDLGSERYEFIERFRKATGSGILISTYTNEGFDPIPTEIDADRSIHFLIIAKMPYPDLSDMRVRILRSYHPETYGDAWYEAETARTFLQMIGRIHRSAQDTGHIFILDPAFTWAYKKWRHAGLIPRYVDEAINLRQD